jgi:hypothetical protein
MGLKTAAMTHGNGSFIIANGTAPAPTLSEKNGPDPLPTPWKRSVSPALQKNGPDPLPTPWKANGPDPLPTPW